MKVNKLKFEQRIDKPIKEVFDFFSDPENLALITPNKLSFKIITPTPIKMKEGQLIDYTIKLYGFEVRWRTLITEYEYPKKFIDQQIKGPYSMWHHVHTFYDHGNYVHMVDEINYSISFGLIGKLINKLLIKKDLIEIFDYRKNIIDKHFKGE